MILTKTNRLRSVTVDGCVLTLAWRELCDFFDKSLGIVTDEAGDLVVRFQVDPDISGYQVINEGNGLRFVGNRSVNILYAVYTFAERWLGFCFYEPGRDIWRPTESLELPGGVLVDVGWPALKNRGLIQEFPPSDANYPLADWMARNRLNYLLTWMKYYDQFTPAMKQYYADRGIQIESGHHNFDYYIPMKKYYHRNPEYFAIIDGHRVQPEPGDTAFLHSKQLCVTNESVRQELTDRIVEYAETHPEVKVLSLVPNDGFGWCECETCQKYYDKQQRGEMYSVSSHVYRAERLYHDLVQDVAGRVRMRVPDLQVSMVAYVNYVEPSGGLVLGNHLAVHVAPYWRCINHAIGDDRCPLNRRYMEVIGKWCRVKDGGTVNIYEYYMGVNLYVSLPMVHHHIVYDEVEALVEKGVDGLLTQFHMTHWTAYGWNYYAMAKAAYDGDRNAISRAFEVVYEEQAGQVSRLFDALYELQQSAGPCHIPVPWLLFNRTDMQQYEQLVDQVETIASKAGGKQAVGRLVIWLTYLRQLKAIFDAYRAGDDVRDNLGALVQWVDAHGESRFCVNDKLRMWVEAWKNAIASGTQWRHFNID